MMPFKQQPDRGCSVSECPYKHEAKGYCKTHYMRSLKGQNPHDYPATDRATIRLCSTPDCGQKHYAHGLCKAEYDRSKQKAAPEYGSPYPSTRREESDDDHGAPAIAKGAARGQRGATPDRRLPAPPLDMRADGGRHHGASLPEVWC